MADIKPSVLVVDDELSIRESFSLILGKDFNVLTAASGEAALKRIIDEKVDLVYLDVRMPGMNGLETLKRIKEIDRGIDVIMVTAVNDVVSATSAIKIGAKDYVVKPFDVHDIINKTKSIIIKAHAKSIKPMEKEELIGSSKQIADINNSLSNLAGKTTPLLIVGEKGLESEIIAKLLSSEENKPLKIIDISSDFRDSDLFGSETGSFTEEFKKKNGILEDSNGGCLLIRNIELLPFEAQVKLTHSIKNNEITRAGSPSAVEINVRVIAETSADLKDMVEEESFDKELFAILSASTIKLSPLREREGDIPILLNHYLEKLNDKYGTKKYFSTIAFDILAGYSWPGNLVEMSNTLEMIVLDLKKDEISPDDLPLDVLIKSAAGGRPWTTLERIESGLEKAHILSIYNNTGKNKEKTSAILGIQLKILESKLESINA
jgi:DNA-binding NtrC family response regulator